MSSVETGERIASTCPSCSPSAETVHEVLSPGGEATVRCTECSHVHKTRIEQESTVSRNVVVSQDGDSFTAQTDVPSEEQLSVGEEFVLEADVAIVQVRITGLETTDGGRVESAPAAEVSTIWTRDVGNVSVNVTLHPSGGGHDETRSLTVPVPGDYAFKIGEAEELGEEEFTVEAAMVRDDATGYEHEKLDERGDEIEARDVKRLYARDDSSSAWSAW